MIEAGSTIAGRGGWSHRATLYGGNHSADLREPRLHDPASEPARIRAMYTHPNFARRGVARLILRPCEAAAAEAGFHAAELMATLAGEPLYRACGYEERERVLTRNGDERVPLAHMGDAGGCCRPTPARLGHEVSDSTIDSAGRLVAQGVDTILAEATSKYAWSAGNLRLAVEAAGVSLWAWNVDDDRFTMDERGFEMWGEPWSETVTFEELSEHIHPADRDRVRAGFAATRGVVGRYETDFRILVGEEVRWISARGRGSDAGIVGRTMFGVFLDVTGRKQAEEGHELLAGEMSHRVKNLLAIAAGLAEITSRSTETTADMARELSQRLTALGRAHDLVRPLPGGQGNAALLGDLLSILLAPYDDLGAFSGRIRVAVERMGVGEATATSLALVIHELATNALKYGALSVEAGTLDVSSTSEGDEISIIWLERGGPGVDSKPDWSGFGSKLVERSVSRQLGGSISYDWSEEGLIVTLKVSRNKLTL